MDEKQWAIVELMGHRKFAGSVRRGQMLEISIPETPNNPAFVKEFGWGSVYGITPCSESVARRAAEVLSDQGRPSRFDESVSLAGIYDPDALNMVADPMQDIDLDGARSGAMREEWEENQRLAAAAVGDDEVPF